MRRTTEGNSSFRRCDAGWRSAGVYYEQARPEVAELAPPACRRVPALGCGSRELGGLPRSRGYHVTGLELVPEMAKQARRWLDRVETADVETDGFPFPPASFDAIIFADALENLIGPWRVLREAVDVLADGGVVVTSIPNV